MKKTLLSLASVLALASCSSAPVSDDTEASLKNPLYAERYYEDRMIHMANLIIQNDTLIEDPNMRTLIDDLRLKAQDAAQEANALQNQGVAGRIVSDEGYAMGEALLLQTTLYLSTDFSVAPAPDLRVYLSNVTDPRDGTFPDETALELGMLKNAYGPQSYEVPALEDGTAPSFATFVLWDATFDRVYGFAQLR